MMKPLGALRFYVYTLSYPSSMGGKVFYVGMGCDSRIEDHEREARNGVQSRKCDVIRKIWANSGQVERAKVQEHLLRKEAAILEARLIREYGLDSLTNENRGHYNALPLRERPAREEQYTLIWTGASGEIFRIDARKHYFFVFRDGVRIAQVFNPADLAQAVGGKNITVEHIQTVVMMQKLFQADHKSPLRRSRGRRYSLPRRHNKELTARVQKALEQD